MRAVSTPARGYAERRLSSRVPPIYTPRVQTSEEAALAANEAFYSAFRGRRLHDMDDLWAEGVEVSCIHPGWDVLIGREQVISSWLAIFANPTSPDVSCQNARAITSAGAAVVVCHEIVDGIELVATNTFVLDGERWRIAHHHASQVLQKIAFTPTPASELN